MTPLALPLIASALHPLAALIGHLIAPGDTPGTVCRICRKEHPHV